jgi:hypothetical protein
MMKYFLCICAFLFPFSHICFAQNNKNTMEKDQQLEAIIKDGFEQIIQYHVDKGDLHPKAAADLQGLVKFFVDQTPYTKKRMIEVIKEINYETIKKDHGVWPDLEFWKNMGDFGSSVALSYDGGIDMLKDQEPLVKEQFDYQERPTDADRHLAVKNRKDIKIDLKRFPVSVHGHYEHKFNESALFYAWIGYLWQEIEGYKCGLHVASVENNSIRTFSLNDFLEYDFLAFTGLAHVEKPPRLGKFFPRKLSLVEIYLRACQIGYPFNPYQNYWRYFEKGNQFMEIVCYENTTGIRTGPFSERHTAKLNQVIKHKDPRHYDSKVALKYLTEFTNKMINEGWQEKLRPLDMPSKMHEEAFDFEIWTGVSWNNEQANTLPIERMKAFEEKHGITLPRSFFHYLRLLNGRQYNQHNMCFPIDNLYNVDVQQFFTIEELDALAGTTIPKNPDFLWIGELKDKRLLGISIDEQSGTFGQMAISEQEKVQICDYQFEVFAKYAQNWPIVPEFFAAEENDVEFFRQRRQKGIDFFNSKKYQEALSQAAQFNSHEVLEFLLEAGLRMADNKHRTTRNNYDEKTMLILDRYQKE